MPKPKSRYCPKCRRESPFYYEEQMKRLYERGLKGAFIPAGWICPRCFFMISDEAETTADREKRAEAHFLIQGSGGRPSRDPGQVPPGDPPNQTKGLVELVRPLIGKDEILTPEKLQSLFDRGGFNVEVKSLRGRGPPG